MKRILVSLALIASLVAPAFGNSGRVIHLGPIWMNPQLAPAATTGATGMILDGATERLGWKYFPSTTSPITHVDFSLILTGSLASTNFGARVVTDSSDSPSTTVLGTQTAEFTVTATGFQGAKALGTDTGALTVSTPVWVDLFVSSGTAPDGSNSLQARTSGQQYIGNVQKIRHNNGTDWTTTALISTEALMVVTHADGTLAGISVTAAAGNSASTDIFGTNRQGMRFKFGARTTVAGVMVRVIKQSTPSDLVIALYEGATERTSCTIPQAEVGNQAVCYFGTPYEMPADATAYIVLRQSLDGGNDSQDYDIRTSAINSSYVDAMLPPDWRFVAGTGNDPTAYTVITTEVPYVMPLILNPATAFDEVAGGGGGGKRVVGS